MGRLFESANQRVERRNLHIGRWVASPAAGCVVAGDEAEQQAAQDRSGAGERNAPVESEG